MARKKKTEAEAPAVQPPADAATAEHGQDARATYRNNERAFVDAMMIDALKPSGYQTRKALGDVSELAETEGNDNE